MSDTQPRPATLIRQLAREHDDVRKLFVATLGLMNAGQAHLGGGRIQVAKRCFAEAHRRLAACLPMTRDDAARLESDNE